MTLNQSTDRLPSADAVPRETMARRRPVATFLLLAYGIGLPALSVPAVADVPAEPFLLVLLFVALLAPALLVTRWADGPGAIRRLLSRALLWRFGLGRWLVVLFAMPVLTVALAAASGTLGSSESGWAMMAGSYLLSTLVVGALIANVWEETAWGGFVQSRFMARHGLLVGSLLTAPLFAAIHVPMYFWEEATGAEIARNLAVLVALAPVYRYLLGMHLLDTGGSVLAIGIQHAAWNSAQNLDAVQGEWQAIVAVVLLTVLVAVGRRVRPPHSRPFGRDAEKAAASGWITGSR